MFSYPLLTRLNIPYFMQGKPYQIVQYFFLWTSSDKIIIVVSYKTHPVVFTRAVYWCQNFDTIRYNTYNSDIQYIVPILYLAFFSRNTVLNNDTTDFLQFISTNNDKDLFESMIQEKKEPKNRKKNK